jgi:hypothetical protein
MYSIAFEGPDGCGKTSCSVALHKLLMDCGKRAAIVSLDDGSNDLACRVLREIKRTKVPLSGDEDELADYARAMEAERFFFAGLHKIAINRLSMSDYADLDCVIFDRWHPLSDLVYAMAGTVSKGLNVSLSCGLTPEQDLLRFLSIYKGHNAIDVLVLLSRKGLHVADYFDARRKHLVYLYDLSQTAPDLFQEFLHAHGLFPQHIAVSQPMAGISEIICEAAERIFGPHFMIGEPSDEPDDSKAN